MHSKSINPKKKTNKFTCCLCLNNDRERGGLHPLLRMIYKLYWMPICTTCEHMLNVKQHYFEPLFRRRRRRKNGRMESLNSWDIDVDGYRYGNYPEKFYSWRNPRDITIKKGF